MRMGIAELEIERVVWAKLRKQSGSAADIGPSLNRLLASESGDVRDAYWRLENHVVAQQDVFEVAEATVSVLVSALADERPRYVRILLLDLLFLILSGSPAPGEESDLVDRCRARAREGYWLILREAVRGEDAASDVLELIEDTGRFALLKNWRKAVRANEE